MRHDDLVTMILMQGPVSPRIRMYWAVSVVHAGCWLPLYCDTLIQWGRGTKAAQGSTLSHEVILLHFLSASHHSNVNLNRGESH